MTSSQRRKKSNYQVMGFIGLLLTVFVVSSYGEMKMEQAAQSKAISARFADFEQTLHDYSAERGAVLEDVGEAAAEVALASLGGGVDWREVVGDMHGDDGVVRIVDSLAAAYRAYTEHHPPSKRTYEGLQRRVRTLESDHKKALEERSKYEQRSFMVGRRFDTLAGKGMYEAMDMRSYRKVVLIADEEQVRTEYRGDQVTLYVQDAGEKPIEMFERTAFTERSYTEYFIHYVAATSLVSPREIGERLSEAQV